jgi:TetR/AcrR family transcriptional regulator, acrAB operon repressor
MRRTAEEAEATRVALKDAALDVFAERGYSATSLEEVATRADVTRGALYHHFADKADLYLAVVGEAWWEITQPILARLEGDAPPLARLERFLVEYIQALGTNPRFRALLSLVTFKTEAIPELAPGLAEKERAMAGWLAQIEEVLAEAASRGELRPGVRVKQAALVVVCFVNGVTTTAVVAPELLDPARQARGLARTCLDGIRL